MSGADARGFGGARIVEQLDLDELPSGRVTRCEVELVHDELGRPTRLPVMVAKGAKPGKVFGLTAGVHGNEINGIPVIHRLMEQLELTRLRGTVVAVLVVNTPGFLRHQRKFRDGVDLNHVFPGAASGPESSMFVHRLVERIVRRFDFLIDLHTASTGRVNSLYVRADMTDPRTAQMAFLQRPDIIVHNPPSDYTLRGTLMEHGVPAITLEIGNPQRFQRTYVKRSLAGVRAVLGELGFQPRRKLALGDEPIICERSYWMHTDRGGLLRVLPDVTDRVEAGAVVAQLRNIYGDLITEYRAEVDGVVIGHSVNPVGGTGARILHLGVPAADGGRRFLRRDTVSQRRPKVP